MSALGGHPVKGICPACGRETLGVIITGGGSFMHCAGIDCPRPTALQEILTTCSQPEHVVDLRADGYSLQHPMIERLDGVLLDRCSLDAWLRDSDVPPEAVGRYVVSQPVVTDVWATAAWAPVEVSS